MKEFEFEFDDLKVSVMDDGSALIAYAKGSLFEGESVAVNNVEGFIRALRKAARKIGTYPPKKRKSPNLLMHGD